MYCHILRVCAIPTLESTDSMITVSTLQNHTVERMWVKINQMCFNCMQQHGEVDLDSPAHQFCTSWFTLPVASAGCTIAVQAWNNHPVPGTL